MSFWGGLARGTGNFAKNTGKAALDLNKAGGSFARWALRLPGHKENAYSKAISNGITNGLQGNPITAGIGRHFHGHDLFAHDQGDGYGIFDPGKGMKESGNGSGSGRGFGNGRGLGNGSGGYGNIYHFHSNNYGTINNNHGTVNNNSGTVNNSVSTNTINGNNYGIQGGSGNTQNFGMSPLVNHLNNAYVDTHIQDYKPPKIATPPTSNALPGSPQKALPAAPKMLPPPKTAAAGKYDDDGNFVPAPRKRLPGLSQLNSPAIYDAPGIKSVIPEKPSFKGPQNNQFKFNPSGESAMNPTQASLLTRKASSMLPYINDVYAFEPEDVRMALALDAAIQFYKNAAEDGAVMDAPAIKTPSTKTREEKVLESTVNPSQMFANVHPDTVSEHLKQVQQKYPHVTNFEDIIHGRYSSSDGTEAKGPRFTMPNSVRVRDTKNPAKSRILDTQRFDDFMANHAYPMLDRLTGGATSESLAQEQAKAKKQRRVDKARDAGGKTLGDTLSKGFENINKRQMDFTDEEPVPGMTGSDIPLGKHKMMRELRKKINTPQEYKIDPKTEEATMPRSEEEIQSLIQSFHERTPHLTLDQKKKQIPQAYHGYLDDADKASRSLTDYPTTGITMDDVAKGKELERRSKEREERKMQGLEPIDYTGIDLPSSPRRKKDSTEQSVDQRTRQEMEKGDFKPGNRTDAPIDNSELATDKEHADARQVVRDERLQDMGLGEDASKDEGLKQRLRERVEQIPEERRRGKVDLDRDGKGIEPTVKKRTPDESKDNDIGYAKEIANRDANRELRNSDDDKGLFGHLFENKGKNASKLDELRTITAGMDSYEIEAIADGLLNLGYGIDHIVQVASEGEDVNGSTSAVADVANVKDSHEIPDWVKRGLH